MALKARGLQGSAARLSPPSMPYGCPGDRQARLVQGAGDRGLGRAAWPGASRLGRPWL